MINTMKTLKRIKIRGKHYTKFDMLNDYIEKTQGG